MSCAPGPVRLGYIDLAIANMDLQGNILTSISDGTHTYSLGDCGPAGSLGCSLTFGDPFSLTPVMLPFELGTTFTMTSQVSITDSIYTAEFGGSSGQDVSDLSFGLFEADGTTPVTDSFVIPEPSSVALGLLGIALILIRLRRWNEEEANPGRD